MCIVKSHSLTIFTKSAPSWLPRTKTKWLPSSVTRVDRKSTRLNSSHDQISYAVFCLKKKKIDKLVLPVPPSHRQQAYRSSIASGSTLKNIASRYLCNSHICSTAPTSSEG